MPQPLGNPWVALVLFLVVTQRGGDGPNDLFDTSQKLEAVLSRIGYLRSNRQRPADRCGQKAH